MAEGDDQKRSSGPTPPAGGNGPPSALALVEGASPSHCFHIGLGRPWHPEEPEQGGVVF